MFILWLGDIPFKKIFYWKGRGERRENFGYKKYPECFYNKSIQDIFYLVFIDMTNELNLLLYRICVNDTHLNSLIFIG